MAKDKVRIKDATKAKMYGTTDERVFTVFLVDYIGATPRLYVDHPSHSNETTMLWARDCVLAWSKNCKERKEALGYI